MLEEKVAGAAPNVLGAKALSSSGEAARAPAAGGGGRLSSPKGRQESSWVCGLAVGAGALGYPDQEPCNG